MQQRENIFEMLCQPSNIIDVYVVAIFAEVNNVCIHKLFRPTWYQFRKDVTNHAQNSICTQDCL